MPRTMIDGSERTPDRRSGKRGRDSLILLLAVCLSAGCASLSPSVPDAPDAPPSPAKGTPKDVPNRNDRTGEKRDSTVIKASTNAGAVAVQPPPRTPAGDSPAPSGPGEAVEESAPDEMGDDEAPLYRYDPMRGAATSSEPPPNRNVTLRELLGLGRSDIADKEDTVSEIKYPRLHDDPLARSPVPKAERDRLLFPPLSNLIFEHDWELSDEDEDLRNEPLRNRSNYDITTPGPDTSNFPNSPYTLPKGRAYIENSPAAFFGKSSVSAAQYNWEFLLRYGLTDDLEVRLFSSGYSATIGRKPTTGFAPLAFDFKYHLWDEDRKKHIPAAGVEMYILTPFGSPYFNGGTQPSIALLLDHSLPFDIMLEHNFGLTGLEDTFGGAVYEFSYQWSLQRRVFKDFAVFTHGFLNSAALPRLPIIQRDLHTFKPSTVVVGGGFQWNLSRRLALFGSYNAGLTGFSPSIVGLLGFAVAL